MVSSVHWRREGVVMGVSVITVRWNEKTPARSNHLIVGMPSAFLRSRVRHDDRFSRRH